MTPEEIRKHGPDPQGKEHNYNRDDWYWLREIALQLSELNQILKARDPESHLSEECRKHECSYYRHYLVYGGPDLTHEGFHHAEEKCAEYQKKYLAWLDEHAEDGAQEPEHLRNQSQYWEKQVRA